MDAATLRPIPSHASPRPWGPAVWSVVAPLVVVYGALYLSASIARPLSDLGGLGYNTARLGLSSALCLAPLAVWPFGVRAYAWGAGLGLTVLAALNLVHVVEYSELVTLGAIDATVSTSLREAAEFLTGRPAGLAGAVFGSALCLAAVAWGAQRIPRALRPTRLVRLSAGLLGVAAGGALLVAPMRLFPVSTVKNAVDYVGYRAEVEEARVARAAHTFGATAVTDWVEPPVVVFVLGESLRPDHLGLYGYARETSPRLGALDGLVVFVDVTAPSPVTQSSVAMMMTGAEPGTIAEHAEGSWMALAHEAGYQTAWVSNQDRTDGTETALLAEDAAEVVYTSHSWSASAQHDEDVLTEVDRVLDGRDGPLALVVHLMGSHDDYSLRYPAAFERFGPASSPPPGRRGLSARERALIDQYDNAALYTDHVVAEVVARVEATGAPAAVVFVSDHGENLFDTPARLRGHGVPGTTPYEVRVPLLAWLSPAMREARPELPAALARNARQPVAAADLFDSVAHLLGTDWSGARLERSVFSERYEPRPRQVLTPTGEVVGVDGL